MDSRARLSAAAAAFLFPLIIASAAWAAEPAEVAREIRDDGVFVESGSDLSEADAGNLVAAVRNEGERFSIIVLTESVTGGATTFGDAVVDRLSDPGLIFVLTPDDVAVVGEGVVYTLEEIDDALDLAISVGGTDTDYAFNFVDTLTGAVVVTPVPAEPAPQPTPEPAATSTPEPSSGGGSGFLWFIVIVGGIGLFIFWMVRRSKQRQELSTENELAAARAEIQEQIDAVANDLLDMEDEVRQANNDRVDDLYNAAGEAYQEASDALAKADTPGEFLDITNDLDLAIWQLDSAEALLDGKAPPPKPTPKRLEPVITAPSPQPQSGGGSGPLGVPPRPSYPKGGGYERRPTRRSRGMSPSIIEMLITLGAGALANRGRRPTMPSARTSPRRTSRGSGRSGGGSFGTGGRIRTGRKRRR